MTGGDGMSTCSGRKGEHAGHGEVEEDVKAVLLQELLSSIPAPTIMQVRYCWMV